MIRKFKKNREERKYYRTNERIYASELRVLDFEGKQIGVLSKFAALAKAREMGLDLVEIAATAKPPVAKIIDFKKFLYQEEKKKKSSQKKAKSGEIKEIRFSPFIAENDYNTRIERIKEFLEEKNKVKLTVVFKGRQLGSKNFGYDLLKKILGQFEGKIHVDMEPKFIGRHLNMVISPSGGKKKEDDEKSENQN